MFSLQVTQLWAVGDILGPPRDLDAVTVALAINRPAQEVAWLTEPSGTQHWANAVRLNKNPFIVFWRSDQAAIWNHNIVRPALVWNSVEGEQQDVLGAIRAGDGERVRSVGPTGPAILDHCQVTVSAAAEMFGAVIVTSVGPP
jgi:hypothetical protein